MLSIDAAYDHYFFNAGSLDQTVTAGPGLVSNVTADVRSNINVFGLQLNMKFL
jgi:long-subunit fatty acid transport protein